MSRLAQPQFSFADLELRNQGVHLDPLLQDILTLLDDRASLIEQVRQDLVRGLKNPNTGRDGITPSQTLRSLILMRVKNWDYRELRERIADGYTLRQFTDFYSQPVPKHDAFQRAFVRLTPETLKVVNDMAVQLAVALGLEDGKKLRVDTTVVETDIHHPTDNTLIWDAVRVVTRLIGRLAELLGHDRKLNTLDYPVSPRGIRILGRIPRLPKLVVQRIVAEFGGLEELLAATDGELETVDGVGEIRAKDIREGLRRQQEINLVDRYLQT